jgi:hypothetical protein
VVHRDPAVQVDAEVGRVADRLPQRLQVADEARGRRRRVQEVDGPGDGRLDQRVPGLDGGVGPLGVARPPGRTAGVAVQPHAVPARPAEQFVHGYAVPASAQVPQRLVEPGDGAAEHGPAAVEAAAGQLLPERGDRQRVLADEVAGQLADRGGRGTGPVFERRVAPAGDALVGADAHEQLALAEHERLDRGDPHVRPMQH